MAVINKAGFISRMFKSIWVLTCVAVLIRMLVLQTEDAVFVASTGIVALSWPSSAVAVGICFYALDWSSGSELQSVVLLWGLSVVFGWFQWFILVPAIVRRLREALGTGISTISCVPSERVATDNAKAES